MTKGSVCCLCSLTGWEGGRPAGGGTTAECRNSAGHMGAAAHGVNFTPSHQPPGLVARCRNDELAGFDTGLAQPVCVNAVGLGCTQAMPRPAPRSQSMPGAEQEHAHGRQGGLSAPSHITQLTCQACGVLESTQTRRSAAARQGLCPPC